MTREQLIEQLEAQEWECAICGGRFTVGNEVVRIFDGVGLAHRDCNQPVTWYVPDPNEART